MNILACIFIVTLLGFSASQYVELQPSEYEDNQNILGSLNFGASHLMKDAVERDVLPEGDYEIILVSKVEQQINGTGFNFRFKLEIAGPQDAHVDGTVTVFNEQATGENEVTHFFYNYYYYPVGNDDSDDNGEDDGEGLTEDDFSWEWYDFDAEEEENDDTVDDWGIDSNILPEN